MHDDALSDTDIAARIRAGTRCQVCREDRRPAGVLCWNHHDELGRILDPDYAGERDLDRAASIPQLYARLDPSPGATTDRARPLVPSFESTPPCNLHVIAMRDDRSVAYPVVDVWYDPHPSGHGDDHDRPHTEDERPPRAVPKAITGMVEMLWDDVHEYLSAPQRPSLVNVAALTRRAGDPHSVREVEAWCRWLHLHLHDLTARDDADDIHRDLTELHDQLRPAAGDPKPKPAAKCTGWVRDPDGAKVECRAPLYMPPPDPGVEHGQASPPKLDPHRPVMRCGRCDRPYTGLMLLRAEIGEQQQVS